MLKMYPGEENMYDFMSFAPQGSDGKALPLATRVQPHSRWAFTTLVLIACLGSVLVAGMTIACLRHYAHRLAAKKLGLGPEGGSFSHQEYQVRGNKQEVDDVNLCSRGSERSK